MKKGHLKIAIGVVALACLVFFLYATDWPSVLAAIRKVGFRFLLLLSVTIISNGMGVLAWRCCMPKGNINVSGGQLFWVRLFGETAAVLNPTSVVGGDALKIFLLREKGVADTWTLHSILLSRALIILSQLFLMTLMGVWLVTSYAQDFYWLRDYWAWGLLLPVSGLLLYVFRRHRVLSRLLDRLPLSARAQRARHYLIDLRQQLVDFYRRHRWRMSLAFLFSCLHWMVGALEFYLILLFLGVEVTLVNALLVDMGVVAFKSVGSFVPGQIGIEEYGNKVMLGVIGITGGTIWVAVSVLRRARQLCWIIFAAVMYFFVFKIKKIPPPDLDLS